MPLKPTFIAPEWEGAVLWHYLWQWRPPQSAIEAANRQPVAHFTSLAGGRKLLLHTAGMSELPTLERTIKQFYSSPVTGSFIVISSVNKLITNDHPRVTTLSQAGFVLGFVSTFVSEVYLSVFGHQHLFHLVIWTVRTYHLERCNVRKI